MFTPIAVSGDNVVVVPGTLRNCSPVSATVVVPCVCVKPVAVAVRVTVPRASSTPWTQ